MAKPEGSKTFYGRSLLARDCGEFLVTEREYGGRCVTPVHAHERALFCLVLDGAYEEQHCHKLLQCTRTTTLFHAAREDHLERFGDCGARSLIVELEPAWMERIRQVSTFSSLQNTAVHDGGILRPLGTRFYREFLSGDPMSRLVMEGVLFEMTGEFFRAEQRRESKTPAWLARAIDMIQASFPNRPTLAQIASEAGVHPVHLAQSFRRFHGCTVGDYVRRIRIEYACQQLVRTDLSYVELANAAGFADQSHFARTFKRSVGMLPSEYRASMRH